MADQRTYFACHDYGMGGIWFDIRADSPEQITDLYPELFVPDEPPQFLREEDHAIETFDIEDSPPSYIAKLVAERPMRSERVEVKAEQKSRPQIEGSNAWRGRDGFMLSALSRTGRTNVTAVIRSFDALSKEVLKRADFEMSLRKLAGAGLVSVGERFSITKEGRKFVRSAAGWGLRRGWVESALLVSKALQDLEPPDTLSEWTISDREYDDALTEYRRGR